MTTQKPVAKDQKLEEEKLFESDSITLTNVKNGTFANVSDCLYFFQRGGAAIVRSLNKNRTEQVHHLTFGHQPIVPKGKCVRNSTFHETFISLRFQLMNDTKQAGTLKINATFIKTRRGYWQMREMYAKLREMKKEFKFDCKHLETPVKFSYSCKSFSIEADSVDKTDQLTLRLNNLQIQPFYTGKVFAESFDCSTLFTLGSLMGLIVMIVFTTVVAIGAYSLINIKTMDRFDSAKGKSIINVAATDQ